MTIALTATAMLALMFATALASPLRASSPGAMLAAAWAVVYGLQALFASDMISNPLASLVVTLLVASFCMGELLALDGQRPAVFVRPLPPTAEQERRLRGFVVFFAITSLAGVLVYARALGIFEASSFEEVILAPGLARVRIFNGELDVPVLARVGFLLAYCGVVLALQYYYSVRWRWWLGVPIVSVLLLGAAQSGRAGSMAVLMQLMVTSYLRAHSRGSRATGGALVVGGLIATVFVGGQLLREGFSSVEAEDFTRVFGSARGYLFGGVSAFAYWISELYQGDVTWGRYSFASLYDALGIAAQEPGVYDYYSPISESESVNVYTAFRSFIDDFTLGGAFVVFFGLGAWVARVLRKVVGGQAIWMAVFVPISSFLLFSPLASLTYFNSFLISCVVPFFVVKLALSARPAAPILVRSSGT